VVTTPKGLLDKLHEAINHDARKAPLELARHLTYLDESDQAGDESLLARVASRLVQHRLTTAELAALKRDGFEQDGDKRDGHKEGDPTLANWLRWRLAIVPPWPSDQTMAQNGNAILLSLLVSAVASEWHSLSLSTTAKNTLLPLIPPYVDQATGLWFQLTRICETSALKTALAPLDAFEHRVLEAIDELKASQTHGVTLIRLGGISDLALKKIREQWAWSKAPQALLVVRKLGPFPIGSGEVLRCLEVLFESGRLTKEDGFRKSILPKLRDPTIPVGSAADYQCELGLKTREVESMPEQSDAMGPDIYLILKGSAARTGQRKPVTEIIAPLHANWRRRSLTEDGTLSDE